MAFLFILWPNCIADHMYFHHFRHLGRHLEILKMLNDDRLSSSRILNGNVLPTRIHQEKNFIPDFQVHRKYAIFVPDYSAEKQIISEEIEKLVKMQVLMPVTPREDQFLSNIFLVPKHDGSHRLILNLKYLNEFVEKHHFKMETLKTALTLVKPNVYFGSLDLRQAYYSLPIQKCCRKFLRFVWEGVVYEYTCLPNGLSSRPRIFSKLLKPMYSALRKLGHLNVAYIDDSFLQSDTYEECVQNVSDTLQLADDLGFTVYKQKSVVVPTQQIIFVGFLICSVTMTVRLPPEKCLNMMELCKEILAARRITIRKFAQLIGTCVSVEPGVQYAALYYKSMEIERDKALKLHKGNFDAVICISDESRQCIQWWINNVQTSFRPICLPKPNRCIESDSSGLGWGCHDVTNDVKMHGQWSYLEKMNHINYLELKAAFQALKTLCSHVTNEHIHLFLDNTTAIKYISKQGGRKEHLNDLAREIWLWCIGCNIWLSCFHIPGRLNFTADKLSRIKNNDMEWSLDNAVFNRIVDLYGQFDIDLFASSRNRKCSKYASFKPDCRAFAVNAFSLVWSDYFAYIFCPFSILGAVLQKVLQDQAEAVIIAPFFATQPWFPRLLSLVCAQSFILPPVSEILFLQGQKNVLHPLQKMTLGVFRISGNVCKVQAFQKTLPQSFCHPGEAIRKNNMGRILRNGVSFVIGKRLISFSHL